MEKTFTLRIKKGKHNPNFFQKLRLQWFLWNKKHIRVRMEVSPKHYDLPWQDQADWNKGIGFSSVWPRITRASNIKSHKSPWQLFGIAFVPGQHVNSQRLVWRDLNGFELSTAYIYHNMQRTLPKDHETFMDTGEYITMSRPKGMRFNLVGYFGGNQKAPEDFTITYTFKLP